MGKGKARAPGIIGLAPNWPQEPPFTLPSINVACQDAAGLWPNRISPNDEVIPQRYGKVSAVGILLSADSGEKLGELLFRLVEWIIAPPTIDLTLEELEGPFIPPAGTILSPTTDEIPPGLLPLIADNTTYSMFVHPLPFQACL